MCVIQQVILINEFLGDIFQFNFHILRALHRCTKVKIGNVEAAKLGIRPGKHTVDEEFDKLERGDRGGDFTGEDNAIASHSDPSAIRIFLVGFNLADDAGEANFLAPILGDVVKLD